jgi:hypothetical protein
MTKPRAIWVVWSKSARHDWWPFLTVSPSPKGDSGKSWGEWLIDKMSDGTVEDSEYRILPAGRVPKGKEEG